MGIMTRLFGGESSDAISSKNEKLSDPTDASVITPLNPGTFASIRTSPVVDAPRYFTKEEADAMKKLAKEKTEGARHAKKAYKSLGQIAGGVTTPPQTQTGLVFDRLVLKKDRSNESYTRFIKIYSNPI